MGLDAPPESPPLLPRSDGSWSGLSSGWRTNADWVAPPTPLEVRAEVPAAAAVGRTNQAAYQTASTPEKDWTILTFIDNMDYDSEFNNQVCDTQNNHTNICDVCFNVDVYYGSYPNPTGGGQHGLYDKDAGHSKPTLLRWKYCSRDYSIWLRTGSDRGLMHLNRSSKPAKRSSFSKPITIPEQIGGMFFADVQGPFEVESLEGSVYKITMAMTIKVDGVLDQWIEGQR